jgi:hypothetical protein
MVQICDAPHERFHHHIQQHNESRLFLPYNTPQCGVFSFVTMTDDFLEAERVRVFAGEDRDLFLHVGYFFTWYNNVEWKITNLMAVVMREQDFSAFDLLVRGMDGKKKVRRLIRLCKIKGREIEQPLLDRLKHYETKICTLRDRLGHNALCRDEQKSRFYFMNFDRLPWKELGMDIPDGLSKQPPDHIDAMTLFQHGLWLNSFSDDLTEAVNRAIEDRPLGMKTPRSPLPRQQPASG